MREVVRRGLFVPALALIALVACHKGTLRGHLSSACRDGGACDEPVLCQDDGAGGTECSEFDAGRQTESEPSDSAVDFDRGGPDSGLTGARSDGGPVGDGGSSTPLDASAAPFSKAGCQGAIDSPSVSQNGAPTVSISFPPARSYTDARMITVRGQASDSDGISALWVNGVAATSADAFSTWMARVPVATGCGPLRVRARDMLGNESTSAAVAYLRNDGPTVLGVSAMDVDTQRQRLIVVGSQGAVLAVEIATGLVVPVADASRGTGPALLGSGAVLVDAARNRALIGSANSDTLLAVDLESGTRSELVSAGQDLQAQIRFMSALALDASGTKAFALSEGSVVALDLQSGSRRVVASDTVGAGPSLREALDLVHDATTTPATPRLLLSLPATGQILTVDLSTGDREVFTGTGEPLVHPGRMKLDPQNERLLVVDGEAMVAGTTHDPSVRNVLVAIELATGRRSVLASSSTGSGHVLSQAFALAFDTRAQRAYVAGKDNGEIAEVALETGARRLLTESNVGSGHKMMWPSSVVFARDSLWLVDAYRQAVVRIDPRTGDRFDVSSAFVGAGPALESPAAIVLEGPSASPSRALVLGWRSNALWGVDLSSGDRTLISPSPPALGVAGAPGLALDAANARVLYTDVTTSSPGRTLHAIDLTSGVRSLISGPERGVGPTFAGGTGVLLDARMSPAKLLVLAGANVVSVEPSTGNRSVVSGNEFLGAMMEQGVADPQKARLIVADYIHGVLEVDLISGRRALLVHSDDLFAGPTVRATSIAVDFDRRVGYVVDRVRNAIVAVDLNTEQRVLLSR